MCHEIVFFGLFLNIKKKVLKLLFLRSPYKKS